jgi:hypothetical protein
MVEAFILYAFNKEGEFSVSIAKVLIASADLKFFQENDVVGKSKDEWFTEWVLKWVRKECPCLLVPFQGDAWEFYLNTEGVAVHLGHSIDYLPVVDLTTAPSGVII